MNQLPEILLVDDDEINNFLTEELIHLVNPDVKITSCTRVNDALEYLEKILSEGSRGPDAILVDLNMPMVSGWEFVKEFERLKPLFPNNVRLYIYTSSVYYEDVNRAKTFPSVSALYTKPLTQEMIEECCMVS